MREAHEIVADFSEVPSGEWFQYWTGNLAADCNSENAKVKDSARRVQKYFWEKYEAGIVHLTQIRAGAEASAYLAMKRG